jgi:7,8-dihydropterin-6-yl-methyl-4-(beta-D-ribofuranosyl)aminobenzene 5'-phosphate synthase
MRAICVVDDKAWAGSPFRSIHGLSFWIETPQGRVLFDTGAKGSLLLHNLRVAGIDWGEIDAIALSHAHNDHTGGLRAILECTGRIPLYAHPDILRERFSRRDGRMKSIGLSMTREELGRLADMRLSAAPAQILSGVHTTGEIAPRPEPEGRSERHFVRAGDEWAPDPYQDDMSIVVQVKEGLVLVCGCCHAGLLNTLLKVRAAFSGRLLAVVGGLHLNDLSEEQLEHIADVLEGYGPPMLYANHCTGDRAYACLSKVFGKLVHPCPAGTELVF